MTPVQPPETDNLNRRIDFFLATRDIEAIRRAETDSCRMTTVEDDRCLYELGQLVRPSRSLEIGIMRRSSSITIGEALMDAGIHCLQTALDTDPKASEAPTLPQIWTTTAVGFGGLGVAHKLDTERSMSAAA
jgi:hypothetical protein